MLMLMMLPTFWLVGQFDKLPTNTRSRWAPCHARPTRHRWHIAKHSCRLLLLMMMLTFSDMSSVWCDMKNRLTGPRKYPTPIWAAYPLSLSLSISFVLCLSVVSSRSSWQICANHESKLRWRWASFSTLLNYPRNARQSQAKSLVQQGNEERDSRRRSGRERSAACAGFSVGWSVLWDDFVSAINRISI